MGTGKHDFPHNYGPALIPDPGNAGSIGMGDRNLAACGITTTGTETRTVLAPNAVGQQLVLFCTVDGGQATVTVNTGHGVSTLILSAAGHMTVLEAIDVGGTKKWRRMDSADV